MPISLRISANCRAFIPQLLATFALHLLCRNALICFAGPRVIEQTIREKLPEGFQRAEYLLDHGMLDRVTSRLEMRDELITIVRILTNNSPQIKGDLPSPTQET